MNILFFTNDPGVQESIRQAMAGKKHSLAMATNYQEAVNILGHVFISLLVVDFNMSQIKCKALLAHTQDQYPDIPVITLSSFPLDQIDLPHNTFASYVGTPFVGNELKLIIESEVQNLVQGGTITNVSPPSFAQLLEMEGKSCILRIFEKNSLKGGLLVFRSGRLVDARYSGFRGMDAACRILAWDETDIFIQNKDYPAKDRINSDLQSIIVKSVHMKDESGYKAAPDRPMLARQGAFPEKLGKHLEMQLGNRTCILDVFHDPAAGKRLREARALGAIFDLGRLKLGCADNGTENGLFVAGPVPTTIKLGTQSPQEKITLLITRYLDTI